MIKTVHILSYLIFRSFKTCFKIYWGDIKIDSWNVSIVTDNFFLIFFLLISDICTCKYNILLKYSYNIQTLAVISTYFINIKCYIVSFNKIRNKKNK